MLLNYGGLCFYLKKLVSVHNPFKDLNANAILPESRLLFNIIIMITASRRLPEFQGLRGKTYYNSTQLICQITSTISALAPKEVPL